jgi:putative oxidoreductase
MFRSTNAGLGLFILRVVVGLIFLWHGLGKLIGPPFAGMGIDGTAGFFGSIGIPMPTMATWFVAILETAGGLALILGAALPIVGLLLAIDMAVAILKVTIKKGLFPGSDLELTLLAACVCLMLAGPGIMAVQIRARAQT